MLIALGDLHGDFAAIRALMQHLGPDDIVLQVGDFGFYLQSLAEWNTIAPQFTTYAIDGNHEDFRLLAPRRMQLQKMGHNLFHVPRGMVCTLQGLRIGFLGGAASIDQAFRTEGISWFPDECITDADVAALRRNVGSEPLDYLITHTPGTTFIAEHFPPLDRALWGLPATWVDTSAQRIDSLLPTLTYRQHLCGHMHQSIQDGATRCLTINEALELR